MKISTRGRYGLKAMLDLAVNSTEDYISLKSIAERQGISENYLEQLFALLKKAGLVQSIRGAQGGYKLIDKAENISVGDILRALEGSLAPVDCVIEEGTEKCKREHLCVTRTVWERIHDSVNETVNSIYLNDLVDEYNKDDCTKDFVYYI